MALRLPKIVPVALERGRVQAWLESHAQTALRYLCAPSGSGKTTCAVLYARRQSGRIAFVSLEAQSGVQEVLAAIGASVGFPPAQDYVALVNGFAAAAPQEIIVDNIDNATADARALLSRLYLDVPDGIRFMYLGRSDGAITVRNARASGLVHICDATLLAFDTSEIVRLAKLLEIPEDRSGASRLCEATHGWAIAVCGACRTAAEHSLTLPVALGQWCRSNEIALRSLVANAVDGSPPGVAAAFEAVLNGETIAQIDLAAFQRAGLFVATWNGRLRLNPLLLRDGFEQRAVDIPVAPAIIEMFGRFEMSINGRPIRWIRRRDSQIVAFLATRPHGRATRAELIAAFWPDADRQLAGQSLRTACSTIRRAVGMCVGRANIARYFISDDVIELVHANAIISSREFAQHCDFASSAFERQDHASCFNHLAAARKLYRTTFLAGEPATPWTLAHAAQFAQMRAGVGAMFDELNRACC